MNVAVARLLIAGGLTEREREILRLLSVGGTYDSIGETLGISSHTVRGIMARVMPKLGARTRVEAVVIALSHDLVSPNERTPVPDMSAGVFEHRRHPGDFYLALGLARDHHTNVEQIVYIPLRVEPEWTGSARMALRTVEDFHENFEYVGERLP